MTVAPAPVQHVHHGLRYAVLLTAALLLAAAVGVLVWRVAFEESAAPPERPELQRILDSAVTGPRAVAPGATAYVRGPHGTWLGSAGLANATKGTAMEPDARMRLESISKIYTATLIYQLAEQKKLKLDDTVERWLPGMLPYGKKITIQQLLNMTSGLIDNNDLRHEPERYLARVKDARLRAQLIAVARPVDANPALEFSPLWWIRWAAWVPLLSMPGASYHYSNIGYDLLGLIAARAGGEPYPAQYRKRIFEPLGLKSTAFDAQGPIAGPHANGYLKFPDGRLTDTTAWHAGVGAEGGIVSNARETAAFLTALMRGRLLGPQSLFEMKTGGVWRSGAPTGCGGMAWGWSGGGDGFKTEAWVNEDGSRVAVLLLNARMSHDAGDLAAFQTMNRLYCAS